MKTFKITIMLFILAAFLINLMVSPLIIIFFELQPVFYVIFSASAIAGSIMYLDDIT